MFWLWLWLWRWWLCWWWSCPEASHARGWEFALPRNPPREALAQKPAMREAGTLGFGCGWACGGGGAAQGEGEGGAKKIR